MTTPYPEDPGIDPDSTEESPIPDPDEDDDDGEDDDGEK
jgi:hypothetical protein